MPAAIDLTGQRFGRWLALERRARHRWLCECICGVRREVLGSALRDGTSRSCGCLGRDPRSRRSVADITGQRFGLLTAIEVSGRRSSGPTWLCRCDCGGERSVLGRSLRSGRAKSCGCRRDGRSYTGEYRCWKGMIQRCRNPRNPDFKHYGGRGITICQRWESFDAFREDMGPRPSADHSIERKDNDGNYEPGNCMWATRAEQVRNRRSAFLITHDGITLSITDWAMRTGIERRTIAARLTVLGWSVSDALTIPVRALQRDRRNRDAA